MTHQTRRLVNHQQILIFVNDLEEFFHLTKFSGANAEQGFAFPAESAAKSRRNSSAAQVSRSGWSAWSLLPLSNRAAAEQSAEKVARSVASLGLSECFVRVSSRCVKEKSNVWFPMLLMGTFALTRWPGLLPPNFSAAYALVFCAGVYLPRRLAWWLPVATMLVTDVGLNLYYVFGQHIQAFKWTQLINYLVYFLIVWLGTRFRPKSSFLKLLSGGLLSAVLFYVITNTAAWFFNPFGNLEYTKDLAGWLIALTKGTAGWPETWELFRNTLLSGGLFTGLFVGAMKLSESAESAREKESPEPAESEDEPVPESEP
jgi:hypothetical protein